MRRLFFLFGLFWLLSPGLWALELYQWVDEQGTIHIADSIDKVPAPYREKAQRLDFSAPKPRAATPTPEAYPSEPPSALKDAYGRDLSWYLEQKKKWLKRAEELVQQIQENEKAMYLLHRGVPEARRGVRTEYGIKLGEGPLLRRWAEYKRLQKINERLQKELAHARYMAQEGVLRQAARAHLPPEGLETIRKDP